MSKDISEARNLAPRNVRREGAGLIIHAFSSFTERFEVPEDRVLRLVIVPESSLAGAGVFKNSLDRIEHVLQIDALRFQTGTASRSTWSFR